MPFFCCFVKILSVFFGCCGVESLSYNNTASREDLLAVCNLRLLPDCNILITHKSRIGELKTPILLFDYSRSIRIYVFCTNKHHKFCIPKTARPEFTTACAKPIEIKNQLCYTYTNC